MPRLPACTLVVLLTASAPAVRGQQPPLVRADTGGCLVATPDPGSGNAAPRDSVRQRSSALGGAAGTVTGRGPAIVLLAAASAREVRFAKQPQIAVRLCGGVLDSVRVLERRNLPDPVQPGVTYRDVYISIEILGHLNAQCLAGRITRTDTGSAGPCASLQMRDSVTSPRRAPP
jgi:hypothetical protein